MLVYAGAVMVMFLFVIAYVGARATRRGRAARGGMTVAAVARRRRDLLEIVVVIGLKAGGRAFRRQPRSKPFGRPPRSGKVFLTDHLLAFEVTSIVLLVAAVGGVILGSEARKRAAAR